MTPIADPDPGPEAPRKGPLVQLMFGRIASRYDLLNRILSLGLDRSWRRSAVGALQLPPGGSAVDLCCGTGEVTAALARRVGSRQVVGVDFSPQMLERARARFPDLCFVQADALDTGLPSSAFDGATVAFALRNVESLDALFAEMTRLVRPGGRVVSLELSRPPGLLGVLHGLVLRWLVPLLGGLFSGQGRAYRYLATSIAVFLPVEDVAERMRRVGLGEIRIVPLHGGIVTLHVGRKPVR